jgi:hypothetical protein
MIIKHSKHLQNFLNGNESLIVIIQSNFALVATFIKQEYLE